MPMVWSLMQVGKFKVVMIALVEGDVVVNHATMSRGHQHNIGFDGARRINDHAGTNAAIMPNTTAHDRPV